MRNNVETPGTFHMFSPNKHSESFTSVKSFSQQIFMSSLNKMITLTGATK